MTIDKSIRQWYASGQLVKKGAVGTRPGFRGPHGSGPGAPSRSAPSGPSGPSGPSAPSGGHHRDAPSPSPSPRPTPSPTPSPHRDPVVTRAPDFVTGGPKTSPTTPTAPVDFDDYNYPGIDKPTIDTGPKVADRHDFEIKKRGTTTITGGNPFLEGPYEKKIVYKPTDLPKRAYDPRTDPNALLKRPSGVLGTLGKIGLTALTAGAGAGLFGKTPALFAKGVQYKKNYDRLQKSALGKKFGLKEFNLNNINKDILKQTLKDDIPKVADRHLGTGKKKRTTTDDRGDGNNIIEQVAGDKNVISKGIKKFTLTDDQRKEVMKRRSVVQNILKQGSYQGNELTNQQRDQLTNYISQIDQYLVPVEMAAYGGRIGKPFGGRIRDI